MKKLLISILSFVLIAFASIGGGLLLSGCGSSYSESTGGGIGDNDLVADILGNALMYWTRDVGSELNNAECITRYGSVIQAKMQNLLGARITTNVKTFACV